MRQTVALRIAFRLRADIVPVSDFSLFRFRPVVQIHNNDPFRLIYGGGQSLTGRLVELLVIYKDLRAAVVDHQSDLARGLAVVDRAVDRADLLGGKVAEHKFRRIEQHIHDHIVFPDPIHLQGMSETVDIRIQRPIGPAPPGQRAKHGRPLREAGNIAHKTIDIGEFVLKNISEHRGIISKLQWKSPCFSFIIFPDLSFLILFDDNTGVLAAESE